MRGHRRRDPDLCAQWRPRGSARGSSCRPLPEAAARPEENVPHCSSQETQTESHTATLRRRKVPAAHESFCEAFGGLPRANPALTGPRNYPPPASLPSRGGKAAPVTSLRDRSPTRRTPVKRQPDPFRRRAPRSLSRTPVTRPPALRRGGGGARRDPLPADRPPRRRAPARHRGASPDASSGRPSRAPAVAAAVLAHRARGRSSGPLSCSGSSAGGGGGAGGAAAAAAALRGVLGGMTRCQGKSPRAARGAGAGGRAHAGHAPSSPDSRYKNNMNVP